MFRADNMTHFIDYTRHIYSADILSMPMITIGLKKALFFIAIMFGVEWFERKETHGFALRRLPKWARIIATYVLILCIMEFMGNSQSFIYFNF